MWTVFHTKSKPSQIQFSRIHAEYPFNRVRMEFAWKGAKKMNMHSSAKYELRKMELERVISEVDGRWWRKNDEKCPKNIVFREVSKGRRGTLRDEVYYENNLLFLTLSLTLDRRIEYNRLSLTTSVDEPRL